MKEANADYRLYDLIYKWKVQQMGIYGDSMVNGYLELGGNINKTQEFEGKQGKF